MGTFIPSIVFGWIEHSNNILSNDKLRGRHGIKLIRGTSKIVDSEGTDVIYGYPCKINQINGKIEISRESKREISELFEKWRDQTQYYEANLGFYKIITGDVEWPSRLVYFLR